MARRDTGTDDARVRVRANRRGSRPRTKQRPEHADAVDGFVVGVDRGRYQVLLTSDERAADAARGPHVVAMKARELGRATAPDPVTGELREVNTDDYCHMLAQFTDGASGVFAISKCCM